jgi:3-dehydroquinate synthetase
VLIPSLKIRLVLETIEPEKIIAAMKKDKKRTGDLLALIMMQNNFDFIKVNNLTPDEIFAVLAECKILLKL